MKNIRKKKYRSIDNLSLKEQSCIRNRNKIDGKINRQTLKQVKVRVETDKQQTELNSDSTYG